MSMVEPIPFKAEKTGRWTCGKCMLRFKIYQGAHWEYGQAKCSECGRIYFAPGEGRSGYYLERSPYAIP